MAYKIANSIDDISNHTILNIAESDNKKFIGIRTQNSVLFLGTNSSEAKLFVVGVIDVPEELLTKLDLEFGLMAKNKVTGIRKIDSK